MPRLPREPSTGLGLSKALVEQMEQLGVLVGKKNNHDQNAEMPKCSGENDQRKIRTLRGCTLQRLAMAMAFIFRRLHAEHMSLGIADHGLKDERMNPISCP